jgi:uncharacterized membrane protein YtjA (UPF0391 family)
MLWTLIVLLLVFWVLGLAFKVAAGAIHVLLVIALVLFLVNLIKLTHNCLRIAFISSRWGPEGSSSTPSLSTTMR